MERTVAVIDIGSNTIKLLVAARHPETGAVETVHRSTLETRLGKGLNAERPSFTDEVIQRGADAVARLAEEARTYSPGALRIVATSAAREANNSHLLAEEIQRRTGLPLDILSGEREAELIGAAVRLDPNVQAENFYVFDLGGGSLECLRFAGGQLEQLVSLPLGCVRVAEKLLSDPAAPFTADDERRVAQEVEAALQAGGFAFSLPADALAIGTGGTLTTSLSILAAEQGRPLGEVKPYLSLADLRHLLDRIAPLSLPDRLKVERLSPGRADVFPTALATFLKLVDLSGRPGLHHSLLNLRYGLAAELLGS